MMVFNRHLCRYKAFSLRQYVAGFVAMLCLGLSAVVSANPFEQLRERLQQELQSQQEQLQNRFDSSNNPQQGLDYQVQPTEIVLVPSLIGMNPSDAAAMLAERGLVLGKVEDIVSGQPAGAIVAQVPAANTQLPAQQRIDVMVSKGGATPESAPSTEIMTTVPNIKGKTLPQARAALAESNLRLGDVVLKPVKQAQASILDQHPVAGKKVQPNAIVDVILADPEKPEKQAEPKQEPLQLILSVERNRLNRGESTSLKIDTSFQQEGMEYSFNIAGKAYKSRQPVINHQFNKAGRFPITASVRLPRQAWVHSKSQWVEVIDNEKPTDAVVVVPDVIGQSLQDAIKTLQALGLRVGTLSQKTSRELEGILEQSPPAGTEVDKETAIDLVEAMDTTQTSSDYDLALAANKETLDENEEAAFQVLLSPMPSEGQVRYRYVINGEVFESKSNTWSHRFEKRGQYQITTEAVLGDQVIARSNTVSMTVDSYWQEPKAVIKPANLVVTQGESAEFSSQSTHDGASSLKAVWTDETGQNSRGDTHKINTEKLSPGEYWLSLRVTDKRGFESVARAYLIVAAVDAGLQPNTGTTAVDVDPSSADNQALPQQVQLELLASAKHVLSGSQVKFSIVQFPAHTDPSMARYHLVFGDGEHAEINQPWIKYEYPSGGIYQAYVTTRAANGLVQSEKVAVWVWPMWLLIGLLITLIALLWRLLSPIFRRSAKKPKGRSASKKVIVDEPSLDEDESHQLEKAPIQQGSKAKRQESTSERQEPSFDVTIESKSDAGIQAIRNDK